MTDDAYTKLIGVLDEHGASYRTIDHQPEGAIEQVSGLRGNDLAQAAKCIVVMVKIGTYAAFASPDIAERLAGSVSGTILPFSFDEQLQLVVDPDLLQHPEIFFNAARLDRSLALATSDYRRIAEPRIERITQP